MGEALAVMEGIGYAPESEQERERISAEAIGDAYLDAAPWLLSSKTVESAAEITGERSEAQHAIATTLAHAAVIERYSEHVIEHAPDIKAQIDTTFSFTPDGHKIRSLVSSFISEQAAKIGLDPEAARQHMLDATADAVASFVGAHESSYPKRELKSLKTTGADLIAQSAEASAVIRLSLLAKQAGKGQLFEPEMAEVETQIGNAARAVRSGGDPESAQRAIAEVSKTIENLLFHNKKAVQFLNQPGIRLQEAQHFTKAVTTYVESRASFIKKAGRAAKSLTPSSKPFFTQEPGGPRRPNWAFIATFIGGTAAVLTACTPPGPATTEAAPTIAPTFDSGDIVTPEPTVVAATPVTFDGHTDIPKVLAVEGKPAGFGGPGDPMIPIILTGALHDTLTAQGYAPVVEGNMLSSIITHGNTRVCVFNTPDRLYNPNVPSGEDDDLDVQNGIRGFGDSGGVPGVWTDDVVRYKAITSISLTGLPEGYTCTSAVSTSADNPGGLSAVRILLLNEVGTVVGDMPGVFSAEDALSIGWGNNGPVIKVNGETLGFTPLSGDVLVSPVPPETPTAEVVTVVQIDPTASHTEWSADVQAQFHDVLTTPATATAEQKQAFDIFITSQWQRTLKDAGVANAESLQGYDLLGSIIEYAKANNIHEVSSLPFALRLQIVSDKNNLIEYSVGKGLDSNLRPSYYGFGWNSSPRPTVDRLRDDAKLFFSAIHFYGETVPRPESGNFVTPTFGLEGDLVLRFDLPGVSPDASQGGLIRMVDANGVARYATIVINYQPTTTTNQQDCITVSGNRLSGGVCAVGDPLGAVRMNLVSKPTDHVPVTREKLDSVMEQSGNQLHIAVYTTTPTGDNVFSDGSAVVASWEVASAVDLNK